MSGKQVLSVQVPIAVAPPTPSTDNVSPHGHGSFRHNPYGDFVFEENKIGNGSFNGNPIANGSFNGSFSGSPVANGSFGGNPLGNGSFGCNPLANNSFSGSFQMTPPVSPMPAPAAVPGMNIPTALAGVVQSTCTTPVCADLGNNSAAFAQPAMYVQQGTPSLPASPHPVQNYSFGSILNTAVSGSGGSFTSVPSQNTTVSYQQQAPIPQPAVQQNLATNMMSPTAKSADSSSMSLSAGALSMASGSPDSSVPPSPTESAAVVQAATQMQQHSLTPQQVATLASQLTPAQQAAAQRKANRASITSITSITSCGSAGSRSLPPLAYEVRVQHKHGRCGVYIHSKSAPAGSHVIVDGDRGLDLGMVIECKGMSTLEGAKKNNKVKRDATEEEVRTWREGLVSDEAKAMKFIAHQIARHSIPIVVHRAEFQFDRKKLTFHYTTEATHPDFRCILKDGYRQFRCRIWLNNCNPKGSDPGQALPITEAQTQ